MESVRTVLHIGASLDWEIHQLDIKTAFLHGDLEEEVYMRQPKGMEEVRKENSMCKLNKTIYSLVQAARGWNLRLHRAMIDIGYKWVVVDHCTRNRKRCTISLSQMSYIDTIVKRLQLRDTYFIHTPINPNVILSKDMCLATKEKRQDMAKFPYMVAIGSLMYAVMGTRLDIVFTVQQLSQ
jgi:hypothetical protein